MFILFFLYITLHDTAYVLYMAILDPKVHVVL